MGARKRQTFGKIQRERERAEKRARKQEKKDEKKAAAAGLREAEAAGIPFTPPPEGDELSTNGPTASGLTANGATASEEDAEQS